MLAVTLGGCAEIDALAIMLLPALGTYDGRLVLDTEPAISCIDKREYILLLNPLII